MNYRYVCPLLLLVIQYVYTAAEKQKFIFSEPIIQMHTWLVADACDRAEKKLREGGIIKEGERASGTIAQICYELKEQGYQTYCDTHASIIKKSFSILHTIKKKSKYPFVDEAAHAFDKACAEQKIDVWMHESEFFTLGLFEIAQDLINPAKFDLRICIGDSMAINNGIVATQQEYETIAALYMAIPLRFNRRFKAMHEDQTKFAQYIKQVPECMQRVQEDFLYYKARKLLGPCPVRPQR